MNEIAFDEEYNAVAVVEPGQCTTQNSSLSMSTPPLHSGQRRRLTRTLMIGMLDRT